MPHCGSGQYSMLRHTVTVYNQIEAYCIRTLIIIFVF
uniref:MPBQ/MSBQ methyltransferase n=1 Tax=Rhizophora mucronata TaxID=61149 RepID=A0A2P2JEN0_RHIMU